LGEFGDALLEKMPWVWIIAGLVVAGPLAVWLGLVAPPHAVTLIRFRGGRVVVSRGSVKAYAREQVGDVLREAGVSSCFIAVTPGNRAAFSRKVPSSFHQRLRNIILNQ
jgi:hypothetical protein